MAPVLQAIFCLNFRSSRLLRPPFNILSSGTLHVADGGKQHYTNSVDVFAIPNGRAIIPVFDGGRHLHTATGFGPIECPLSPPVLMRFFLRALVAGEDPALM